MIVGTIESVYRYPVKSMAGEEIPAGGRLEERGLIGDRSYALLDAASGTVVSAKHPRKWGRLLEYRAAFVDEPSDDPGAPTPARITLPDGATVSTDTEDIDGVLSREIGRPVRLVSRPPSGADYEDVWPDVEGVAPAEFIAQTRVPSDDPSETVSRFRLALAARSDTFFDIAPLHLLTTASLARVQQLYPAGQFVAARFRPNLVVRTPEGVVDFLENDWVGHRVRIGTDVVLKLTLRVPRCVMTTLPQGELSADLGILRTLATHNRVEFGRSGRWACLGVYASVLTPGRIRPGDPVMLESTEES